MHIHFFKRNQYLNIIILSLFACYFVGLITYLFNSQDIHLWDFKVYYSASKCYLQGLDPYNIKNIIGVYQNVAPLPYMYPPIVTYCFIPFTYFDINTACTIYNCLKLLALSGLFLIWFKIYYKNSLLGIFMFFSLLAFNATVYKDLFTGNISIFEQFFIWLGVYYFMKDKLWVFAISIIIISSVKLLPIVFLLFLLFSPSNKRFKVLFLSSILFLSFLFLNYLLEPTYTVNYISSFASNAIKEGGITNACSLEFFKTIIGLFGECVSVYIAYAIYLFFVCMVSAITWITLKGIKNNTDFKSRRLTIFLLCLTVIIILPRFKDYSYILAILPVFYIIVQNYKNISVIALIGLVCLSARNVSIPIFNTVLDIIWSYYTFIIVIIAWISYIRTIKASKSILNKEDSKIILKS